MGVGAVFFGVGGLGVAPSHAGFALPLRQPATEWARNAGCSALPTSAEEPAQRVIPVQDAVWQLQRSWSPWQLQQAAAAHGDAGVEGKIGAGDEEVAELLDATLAQKGPKPAAPPRVLTTRREALSLYRDILRHSRLFVWRDERGRPWQDALRASARQEFEAARYERDPELVTRMIVTARDAVQKSVERFMAKRDAIQKQEDAAAASGLPGTRSHDAGSPGSRAM